MTTIFSILSFVVLAVIVLSSVIKIIREYERIVVFTFGRYTSTRGPGFVFIIPGIQQVIRVDLRTVVLDIPAQDLISKDNVTVKVSAVLYFRVTEPAQAINQVENFRYATGQLSQTTLRSVLGEHDLDEMLSQRETLNRRLQQLIDKTTEAWGIKVSNVEIKNIDLNDSMIRAIAKQAEAERERRAKIIQAEGEQQAAAKTLEAAEMLSRNPKAMELRYLQTLQQVSTNPGNTIVFPFPTDLVGLLKKISQ